jgi:hypothetical protein
VSNMTAHQRSAQVAVAVRLGDAERERTARQNLAEAKIAEYIERALAVAPPLTPAQIKRLTGLLRGGQR